MNSEFGEKFMKALREFRDWVRELCKDYKRCATRCDSLEKSIDFFLQAIDPDAK